MKKTLRAAAAALAVILCLCALASCGQTEGAAAPPALSMKLPSPPPNAGDPTPPPKEIEDQSIRQDAQGLVRIHLQGGGAAVSFDVDRWRELYGTDIEEMRGVQTPILAASGRVADACVGRITGFASSLTESILPTIVLLMEDGGLEWLEATPGAGGSLSSRGALPMGEVFTSLSYEPVGKSVVKMSIFAKNAAGERFDLFYPISLTDLAPNNWICELEPAEDEYDLSINGYLTLLEDGTVYFETGIGTSAWGEAFEVWEGRYQIAWKEEQYTSPGTIRFELNRLASIYEGDEDDLGRQKFIDGTYLAEIDSDGALYLYWVDGDPLHPYKFNPGVYEFYPDYGSYGAFSTGEMTDDELLEYLLFAVPEAQERVNIWGMSARVTGEVTDLFWEGLCRDIWLGTDLGGKFTREILYIVGPRGAVYRFDAQADDWVQLCGDYDPSAEWPAYTILAYVKFDKKLSGGLVRFLVDEVVWVTDEEEPDDYRIENDEVLWVPYVATEWTEYSLWEYHSDAGMQSVFYSMDDFVKELRKGWRSDGILARVAIAEETIEFISEVYTP